MDSFSGQLDDVAGMFDDVDALLADQGYDDSDLDAAAQARILRVSDGVVCALVLAWSALLLLLLLLLPLPRSCCLACLLAGWRAVVVVRCPRSHSKIPSTDLPVLLCMTYDGVVPSGSQPPNQPTCQSIHPSN